MRERCDAKPVIIAGMPRGGATSLYHILNRHPALFVPYRKETAYFSYNYYKGERWYRGLFREMPPACFGLDVSPQYFMDPRSIERVKAFAPDTKVILAIRDPVDWIGGFQGSCRLKVKITPPYLC